MGQSLIAKVTFTGILVVLSALNADSFQFPNLFGGVKKPVAEFAVVSVLSVCWKQTHTSVVFLNLMS